MYYKPTTLDLATIPEKLQGPLLEIIRIILHARLLNRESRTGFVPVSRKTLRGFIPSDSVTVVRDAILALGVLETDNHYVKGKKAKGFRLAEKYRDAPMEPVEIVGLTSSEKGRNKARNQTPDNISKQLWADLKHIEIAEIDDALLQRIASESKHEWDNAHGCYLMANRQIRNKDFWFIRDAFGRIHSNVTNLKSELRNFLTWKGETLIATDIANSQPHCLGGLLWLFLTERSEHNGSVMSTGRNSSFIPSTSILAPLRSSIMNCTTYVNADEIRSWCDISSTGMVYERLAERLGPSCTRNDAKKAWNLFAYGQINPRNKLHKVFQEDFPTMLNTIVHLKRINNLPEGSKYAYLAHLLQYVESWLVIDTACVRLKQEHPGIPLITIHDSIVTTVGNEASVKLAIENAFRTLSMGVTVGTETYSPSAVE